VTHWLNWRSFWQWDSFSVYVIFLGILTVISGVLTTTLISYGWFVEGLGCVALSVEATLGLPQLYLHHKNKSTKGFSPALIGTWLIGDSYKLAYFLFVDAPLQFTCCGIVQLVVDFLILFQIYRYRKNIDPNTYE